MTESGTCLIIIFSDHVYSWCSVQLEDSANQRILSWSVTIEVTNERRATGNQRWDCANSLGSALYQWQLKQLSLSFIFFRFFFRSTFIGSRKCLKNIFTPVIYVTKLFTILTVPKVLRFQTTPNSASVKASMYYWMYLERVWELSETCRHAVRMSSGYYTLIQSIAVDIHLCRC